MRIKGKEGKIMAEFKEMVLFKNRKDAGQKLGKVLKSEELGSNPLILGVPRGGVEIAFYVSEELNCDFSLVISKKLGFPGNEEFAFGAITEDGSIYISEKTRHHLNQEIIDTVKEDRLKEIERRVSVYRNGEPLPTMKNRTVVIVDDGIATGSTLIPVIEMCKKNGASKVIVAAPVAPETTIKLFGHADQLVVLARPEPFYAVGQFYEDFHNMEDEEMMQFLK